MKNCNECKDSKLISEFPKVGHTCKKCLNKKQRIRRKKDNNIVTKRYEKTKNGFLVRLYRNMDSRINGVQKLKHHLYANKYLLSRNIFYKWALENSEFHLLFQKWENSNYDRKLTPSVDRIDSSKGYFLLNMEWVTHSENSRRGSINRHKNNK